MFFTDIIIHDKVLSLAKNASTLKPIAKHSIIIKTPTTYDKSTGEVKILDFLKSGNKLFDVIYFAKIVSMGEAGRQKNEAFRVVDSDANDVDIDITRPSILAVSLISLFHSRGSLPTHGSATPMPNMFKKLLSPDEGSTYTEGNFVEEIASFDLGHINLKGIYGNKISEWGLNEEFANRMVISMAGHKPYHLCQELMRQYGQQIPGKEEITNMDTASNYLVNTLGSSQYANKLYVEFHPSSQEVAKYYPKFYKNSMCAIFTVLRSQVNLDEEAALKWMRTRSSLKNEMFVREGPVKPDGNRDPAPILSWPSGLMSYNMKKLEQIMSKPWHSVE